MAEEKAPKAKSEAPQSEVAELRALIQAQANQIENLQKLIAAERPAALPAKIEQDREDWYDRKKAELSKSVDQRTQEEAERRWGQETAIRYAVQVAFVPRVLIPARSAEEARARYDDLCGILSVDREKHQYKVEKVQTAAA